MPRMGFALLLALLAINTTLSSAASPKTLIHNRAFDHPKLPVTFEPNQGQAASDVRYLSRNSNSTVLLEVTGLTFLLKGHREDTIPDALQLHLVGANSAPQIQPGPLAPSVSNYFLGRDHDQWHVNVPNYSQLTYRSTYPGIDLVYYSRQGLMEYDFIVAPGSDPNLIRMQFSGARHVSLDADGGVSFGLVHHRLTMNLPFAYQTIRGVRHPVDARFVRTARNEYGFRLGNYDRSKELIIDPTLTYSTFLGGSDDEGIFGIGFDPEGNIYVAGETSSINFPDRHAAQPHLGGSYDAFVSKFDHTGKHLIYSTYLGGSNYDHAVGISVDEKGSVVLAGLTNSSDFPVVHPYQPNLGGSYDGFIARLAPSGAELVFSTYIGGTQFDGINDVAQDKAGNIYIAGSTSSSDFPVSSRAFQRVCDQGFIPDVCTSDAFIAKFNPTGSELLYSTYLGGSAYDTGAALAVDDTGAVYVAGQSSSRNFPTADPFQASLAGYANAWLTKISPDGEALLYSTYLGGNQFDAVNGIAVDPTHHAYLTGFTSSTNFPIHHPVQSSLLGQLNGFVAKFSESGTALDYSTYLGGNNQTYPFRISVDPTGAASVIGFTSSTNFPTIDPIQASFKGGAEDAFLSRFKPDGSGLAFSTYLGGTGDEYGYAITTDLTGALWIGGSTSSTNYPMVRAYQPKYGGGPFDAFLSRVSLSPLDSIAVLKAAINNLATAKEISTPLKQELAEELDRVSQAIHSSNVEGAREAIDCFEVEILIAAFEGQLSNVNTERLAVAGWDLHSLISEPH
jgi:hypothetical protein